jgi:hypothetical protein
LPTPDDKTRKKYNLPRDKGKKRSGYELEKNKT